VTPAIAGDLDAQSRRVSTADLNLASAAGVAALHHRITAAVAEVCGDSQNVSTLSEQLAVYRCRAKATADADQSVAALLPRTDRLAAAH